MGFAHIMNCYLLFYTVNFLNNKTKDIISSNKKYKCGPNYVKKFIVSFHDDFNKRFNERFSLIVFVQKLDLC